MQSKIKIGLIGCGRAAELIYLPALGKYPEVQVSAVVDPVKERRDLISGKLKNCSRYGDIEPDFINQIDAAVISTPPDSHVPLASALLKNNKFVLVEKPLALSMDGIKELCETESASKAFLIMGFNHRYWQPVVLLKEKILNGLNVHSAEIIFTGNYSSWDPVSFKSDPLNDLGPHVFDLVRFAFQKEIVSISARSFDANNLEVKIKMPGDLFVHCFIAHSNKTLKSIKIIFESGIYFITAGSERIHPEFGIKGKFIDLSDKFKRKLMRRSSPVKRSFEMQLENLFSCIKSGIHSTPDINDGISAIKAVKAARESITKGKEIFLNEIN